MNFRQLFDSSRLADYPNNRLTHPALAIPDGAPVYNLATAQDGVILTRNGENIDISQIPGLPGWVVERFNYWNAAYNYALDFFWEQEPDAYALEAYGISVAADMADALNGCARVQYCGMPLHSEKALGYYFRRKHCYSGEQEGIGFWHVEPLANTVYVAEDAPLTPYMLQMQKAGEKKEGGFDAIYRDDYDHSGYLNCILTIFKKRTYNSAWEDYMPDWMEDFAYGTLCYCYRMWYGEKYDWKPHAWLYALREDAMLIDLAKHCKCAGGIAYKYGNRHISRPFPLGE